MSIVPEDTEKNLITQQTGIFSVIVSNFGNLKAMGYHDNVKIDLDPDENPILIIERNWIGADGKKYAFIHSIKVESEICLYGDIS